MLEYKVEVKRKFRHMRIYRISKKMNDNTNAVSRMMQALVDKYILKKGAAER